MTTQCSGVPVVVEALERRGYLSGATQLVHTIDVLPQGARDDIAATSVGTKAIFAGGSVESGFVSSVDIYDNATGHWSAATLSLARSKIAAASVGTKAIFAGGRGLGLDEASAVDIYDDATGVWSTAILSQARDVPVATTAGSKVLIANAWPVSKSVDIYDDSTGQWSTAIFRRNFSCSAATSVGNLAFFAGGDNADGTSGNLVYIYNATTNHWSTTTLPEAANFRTATTVGTKAIFGGGTDTSSTGINIDTVDIFDTQTGRWTTAKLSLARTVPAVALGSKAIFAGGLYSSKDANLASAVVDIYDADIGQWSTTTLSEPRAALAGTIVGNKAMFAGGVELADNSVLVVRDRVDIFTLNSLTPTAQLLPISTRKQSRQSYTFTIRYHGYYKPNADTLDNNDIIVTGPNGFEAHADLISQSRGKRGSTRTAIYAIHGPGRRWDAGDNGVYTIHVQDRQVLDSAGDAVIGRPLGSFTVAIPAPPAPATPPTTAAQLAPRIPAIFQTRREIDALLRD